MAVDVPVFTHEESTEYLEERIGLDDQAGAHAVATELGNLPLALAQAAATITGRQWTFQRYVTELAKGPVELACL